MVKSVSRVGAKLQSNCDSSQNPVSAICQYCQVYHHSETVDLLGFGRQGAPLRDLKDADQQRVAKKFDLPTMDVKVLDVSKTEIDEEAFEYLLSIPDLGVLEIHIPGTASLNESFSSSSFGDTAGSSGSDDTVILELSPFEINRAEDSDLSQMTENILKSSPGGEKVINEYYRTKSLSDGRRRDMVKILVAHMTNEHGTSPSRPMKEEYAKGIISLFAYLADPKSNLGYAGTATCLPF
ncbi:hypothetical protein DPEC_G00147080 [Dallia pectoralis]|uniref:Uncharacterized protein n=1 Tax=Dallia pectoralis TaxID=75939 RepID=A0ACC2GI73_DALPE|nr:hypothetical protein DPEC_G00147080 [Dallia pectoralis]